MFRINHPLNAYHRQMLRLALPYILFSSLLIFLPAVVTVGLAFTTYSGVSSPEWVGLANFRQLAGIELARLSLWSSFVFVAMAVPLRLFGAVGLALLLDARGKVYSAARVAVYVPTIIPEVAYSLIWLWLVNPLYGPINQLLDFVGLPSFGWLLEPSSARATLAVMAAFQLGEGFFVLLAGLRTIPRALYEAARVDGAGRGWMFWHITRPLLAPWMLILFVRDLVVTLEGSFTPSFVMTYGGPDFSTLFAPLMVYEIAFDYFRDFGLASAFLVVIVVMLATISLTVWNFRGWLAARSYGRSLFGDRDAI